MATTTARLLTIAEFDKLDLPEDRDWELHEGELVEMTFPIIDHRMLQQRLLKIFEPLFPAHHVMMEYPFQLKEINDKRSADVAVVERGRAQTAKQQGILNGTPDMLIEVLSTSNSASEMRRYRRLCFRHDTLIFVMVDLKDNTVEVFLKDRTSAVYEPGGAVPIALLGVEATVAVNEIFAGITLP